MLIAQDLIALRKLAGFSRVEMAQKLSLTYALLLEYEETDKRPGCYLTLKWLFVCRLATLPYFFHCCWQPQKLLQAADPQLVQYLRSRKFFLIQSCSYLIGLYLLNLILLQALQLSQAEVSNYIYLIVCLCVIAANKSNSNITSLVALLLIVKLQESLILQLLLPNLYAVQSFYFLCDLTVVILIAFRPAICRQITSSQNKAKPDSRFYITQADMLVAAIYMLYLVVSLLSIGEHVLRHLDHIGLEYSPWLNEHARVIWSNHTNIKLPLNMLEFVALLTTINWRLVKYKA